MKQRQVVRKTGEIVRFYSYIINDKNVYEGIVVEVKDEPIMENGFRRIKYIIQPIDQEKYGFDGLIDRFHPYFPLNPDIGEVILDNAQIGENPIPTQNIPDFEIESPERDLPNVLEI